MGPKASRLRNRHHGNSSWMYNVYASPPALSEVAPAPRGGLCDWWWHGAVTAEEAAVAEQPPLTHPKVPPPSQEFSLPSSQPKQHFSGGKAISGDKFPAHTPPHASGWVEVTHKRRGGSHKLVADHTPPLDRWAQTAPLANTPSPGSKNPQGRVGPLAAKAAQRQGLHPEVIRDHWDYQQHSRRGGRTPYTPVAIHSQPHGAFLPNDTAIYPRNKTKDTKNKKNFADVCTQEFAID